MANEDNLSSCFIIKKKDILFSYFPYLIITFCVFVDLLNGIIVMVMGRGFTVGVVYRGFLTILLSIYVFKSKGISQLIIFGMIILFLINNIIWLCNEPFFNIAFDLKMFARFIYPILILHYFIVNRKNINENKLLELVVSYGTIASYAILFSFITGIGIQTYGQESFGVKSFFEGQNDISLVLLFCLIISLYFFLHDKRKKYLLYAIIITCGSFLLGTRAGMAFSLFIWLVIIFSLLLFRFRSSYIRIKSRMIAVLITLIFVGFSVTLMISIISKFDGMMKKFTFTVIVQGAKYSRSGLIQSAEKIITEGDMGEILFGHSFSGLWRKNYENLMQMYNGTYLAYRGGPKLKSIESDLLETYGSYGLFLGLVIIIVPVLFAILSIKNFLANLSLKNYLLMMGLIMFLGHAYYAGHAIGSIGSAPPLAVIYYCVYNEHGFLKKMKSLENGKN